MAHYRQSAGTDSGADIMPFGKYKDQPIDLVLADQDYVEWLATKPGIMAMMQKRFPAIFNIITVGAPKSDDTPAHNKMQALFLSRDFQYAFVEAVLGESVHSISSGMAAKINSEACALLGAAREAAVKKLSESQKAFLDAQIRYDEHKKTDPELDYRKSREEHRILGQATEFPGYEEWLDACQWGTWPYRLKGCSECVIHTERRVKEDQAICARLAQILVSEVNAVPPQIDLQFECGYDVLLTARWQNRSEEIPQFDKGWTETVAEDHRTETFHIELKPQMGDDFPSVLRQMKRTMDVLPRRLRDDSCLLVIGTFESAACTLEQVRSMFGGFKIVTLSEIQAIQTRGVWPAVAS